MRKKINLLKIKYFIYISKYNILYKYIIYFMPIPQEGAQQDHALPRVVEVVEDVLGLVRQLPGAPDRLARAAHQTGHLAQSSLGGLVEDLRRADLADLDGFAREHIGPFEGERARFRACGQGPLGGLRSAMEEGPSRCRLDPSGSCIPPAEVNHRGQEPSSAPRQIVRGSGLGLDGGGVRIHRDAGAPGGGEGGDVDADKGDERLLAGVVVDRDGDANDRDEILANTDDSSAVEEERAATEPLDTPHAWEGHEHIDD